MPAFGVVDASRTARSRWRNRALLLPGKDATFAFGCAVPFGLNSRPDERLDTTATA